MLIKLHPTTPWRIGPDSGDRDRVDRIYHSDSLYSAVSSAMARLGALEEWLDATARAGVPASAPTPPVRVGIPLSDADAPAPPVRVGAPFTPAVRFSSCFPFQGDVSFIVPPRSLWPPPASPKVRWRGAKFVPLSVINELLTSRSISEEGWTVDPASECLIPIGTSGAASGPFRVSVRSSAAIDRRGSGVFPHSTACIEFAPNSGLWAVAAFADEAAREKWSGPLKGAIRLLADSGFGGERSRGWGRAEVSFSDDPLPFLPAVDSSIDSAWWMLSLFHPASGDSIDWGRGSYSLTTRGGRVESPVSWGNAKNPTRMIAEGSVIVAASGAARVGVERRARRFSASRLSRRLRALRADSPGTSGENIRMKYRLTCLTPTLIGDGQRLAPIDYMVWKDHVNVLDQRRIFRLLAKGPRLDGYLAQLKKAARLDFASWGGFAQNFAGRRIPFEHSSAIPLLGTRPARKSFHPDLRGSPSGPYVPGTAIKGALRTGAVFDRWSEKTISDLAARLAADDRPPRNPAARAEEAVLGGGGSNRMRRVSAGDSLPITHQNMKVYLIRVSTLVSRKDRQIRGRLEIAARYRWMPAASKTARRCSSKWLRQVLHSKGLGRNARSLIGRRFSQPRIATPRRSWGATKSTPHGADWARWPRLYPSSKRT